ncbi:MAG TPA: helix-turn-helix transcriptional regulator [Ktedonobacterales bacterium]|nr:helix-turn-helix transcriptional regulator [Ktedonobacterales bacterium]
MKLGDRLREIRQQQEQTLLQVAKSTGLSVSYLSDLERGRTNPSMETLKRLADHYQQDLADLVANVDGQGGLTLESLPPGLAELVTDQVIDEETARDLSRIELRGQRPRERDDWLGLYYHLKGIMRQYLPPGPASKEE